MSNFKLGILWFLLSSVISAFNDGVIKYLSHDLAANAITQYRFIFATVTMLPILVFSPSMFKTKRYTLHLMRGLVLFIAIYLWCSALAVVKITSATVISFTIPIFVLIMAPIFLKERVSIHLWVATGFCFVGIMLISDIGNADYSVSMAKLLVSAIMFASLDIINKKFVSHEPLAVMLFYSNLVTALLSFVVFGMPTLALNLKLLILLLLLGIGANAILYCVLKAFTYINASLLSPFRYLELILTFAIGYTMFGEAIDLRFIMGAIIIIACTLYTARYQSKLKHAI